MSSFRIASLILAVLASIPASAQLATTVNDNSITPAPPAGALNVIPQNDGGRPTVNVTHYALYSTNQVRCTPGGELSTPILQCLNWLGTSVGGICDARACYGNDTWTGNLNINVENATLLLPCSTIAMSGYFVVNPGIRNTTVHGCTYHGGSQANGDAGGTLFNWTGSTAAFTIGDPSYAANTNGFSMDNVNINTAAAGSTAKAFQFYRTQEIDLENLSLNGDGGTGQTAIALDGTGNYTGGIFTNNRIQQFNTAFYLTGHLSGSVSDDYANASTYVKNHVDCPTSGGSPIAGTYGFNIIGGDGNTFAGGDVEGCATVMHLGSAATSNTVLGLRNENSTMQFIADTGSTFNYVANGGTFFTGQLSDSGSRNSWWDAFHRTVNGIAGDWYASQLDSTITNHQRLGIGLGNERGLLNEVQTDYGYRWTYGFSDGTAGSQFWQLDDLLNNVNRIAIAQYLSACTHCVTNVVINNPGLYTSSTPPTVSFSAGSGSSAAGTAVMYEFGSSGTYGVLSVTITNPGTGYTANFVPTFSGSNQTTSPGALAEISPAGSTNDQTVLNSAATGAIVLNGSNNSGTGGVVIGSGGATATEVANFDNSGNLTLLGNLKFNDTTGLNWSWECDTPPACTLQDASATTPARVFKANQNGQTDIDSQTSAAVTVNNTATGGTGGFAVYGGGPTYYNTPLFSVTALAGVGIYHFPALAAASGHVCLHADNSGYVTPTSSDCGTSSSTGTVTTFSATAPTDITVSVSNPTSTPQLTLTWTNGTGPALAAAATAAASAPAQCASNFFATGVTTAWAANCLQVTYAMLTGTPPTWNQNSTGESATAAALAATPTLCTAGNAPTGVTAAGNATSCAPTGTIEFSTAASSLCTTGTCYMATGYTGGSNYKGSFISPRAGLVQNCSLATGFATTGSNYYTATLLKNGSACTSGPTVTLNGGSHVIATDNTHTCTVAQGDQLTWQMVVTGTITGDVGYGTCQY